MDEKSNTDEKVGEERVQKAQARAGRKLAGAAQAAKAKRAAALRAFAAVEQRVEPDPEASEGGAAVGEEGGEGEGDLRAMCGKLDKILARLDTVEKKVGALLDCCSEEELPPGAEVPGGGEHRLGDGLELRLKSAPYALEDRPPPVELHLPRNPANLHALKAMRDLLSASTSGR